VKLISKWSGAALCCAVSVALLGTLLYAASAGTSHIPINEKVRVTGVILSRKGDLIARRTSTWTIDEHLADDRPNVSRSTCAIRLKCTAELRVTVSSEAATAAGIGSQPDRVSTTR